MKNLLRVLLIFLAGSLAAQTTSIPDANFEQALIDLGYDTGVPDGVVITSSIDTITRLSLINKNISDMTGIEDFTALTYFNCSFNNPVTYLDFSKNIHLEVLTCSILKQLVSINITKNIALTELNCRSNPLLTSINLSQNTSLITLDIAENGLQEIDVSNNPMLNLFYCHVNKLTCLNMKNGNNIGRFTAHTNPNLTCVEVDDTAWYNANFSGAISNASFSVDCQNPYNVSTSDKEYATINIDISHYPNPTNNFLFIEMNEEIKQVEVFDINGRVIKKIPSTVKFIDVKDLSKGVYLLSLLTKKGRFARKFVKR